MRDEDGTWWSGVLVNGDHVLCSFRTWVYPTPAQAEALSGLLGRVARYEAACVAGGDVEVELPEAVRRAVQSRVAGRSRRLMAGTAPLDGAVMAVDAFHVHVEGVESLLVADVWRLPLGLSEALLVSGVDEQRAVDGVSFLAGTHSREVLAALRELVTRHAGVVGRPVVGGGVRRDRPHRARHTTLQRLAGADGAVRWALVWSVRVPPGWVPPAAREDTVGVDVGVRNPLTWSDGVRDGLVPRLSYADLREVGGVAEVPVVGAVLRRAVVAEFMPALDEALREVLAYRQVAVERTRWEGLEESARAVMTLAGLPEVLSWVRQLGRVSGSRVVAVPPWGSSVQCGRCGRVGVRAGRVFSCAACGVTLDADVNAARYCRWWALRRGR